MEPYLSGRRAPRKFCISTMAALAALLLISGACGREEPGKRPSRPKPAAKASFVSAEVRGLNPADKPEAGAKAAEEAPKVIALLNSFYDAAFIKPDKWQRGTHPELASFFTAEAQPHVGPNLEALALADLAPRLRAVDPRTQQAPRMTFLVEDDLSTPAGVVTVVFEGRGTAVKKSDGPVAIIHNASYWLLKEGDSYKISAFTAELKADTETKKAAFGVQDGAVAALASQGRSQ